MEPTFFEVAHPDPKVREALKLERLGWPMDGLPPHVSEHPLKTYLRRCEKRDGRIERHIGNLGLAKAVAKVYKEYDLRA